MSGAFPCLRVLLTRSGDRLSAAGMLALVLLALVHAVKEGPQGIGTAARTVADEPPVIVCAPQHASAHQGPPDQRVHSEHQVLHYLQVRSCRAAAAKARDGMCGAKRASGLGRGSGVAGGLAGWT